MTFLELAKRRYSVRDYKSKPIEDDKLRQILKAAHSAPTAHNLQPFSLIVVHTKDREDELRRIYSSPFFVQAPIIICACSIPSQSWIRRDGKKYCEVDVTIAMDHLILAATDLGLGTCWIAEFDPQAARETLRLPKETEPIVFTPLGYPDAQPRPKKRKSINELVHYENW
ncbi:nitroreductase family protein [Chloroflexota bacterium]